MSIREIWVLGTLAALFLAIPLLKPFINRLRGQDGLVWLPLIALGILVGIFPAFGFRPEVIPMLVFALFFNLGTLISFVASSLGRPGDTFRERGPFRTIAAMVLLVVATVPMFAFAPQVYARHERDVALARDLAVSMPGEFLGHDYVLRIYGPVQTNRPLIFLVPPEIGSAASIELICESLYEKGFTVITFFRKDYDTLFIDENGRRHLSPGRLLRYWRIFRRGTDLASVNERGRALEAERRIDIEFLLPRLPALLGLAGRNELPPVLFVGYGAGGSALAYMAGEGGFLERHSDALGVIAIGSHLWSSYLSEPRFVEPLTDTGMFSRLRTNIANWFRGMRRERVGRTGPLPETGLPVLYLVSGRALETGGRQNAYRAVFDALHSGSGPVALVAVESAGPLDFQDFPLTQPMLSFFFSGLRGAGRSQDPIGDTAGIIGNFASYLLERKQVDLEYRQALERNVLLLDEPPLVLPLWDELPESYEYDTTGAEIAEPEIPVEPELKIPPRSVIRSAVHMENRGLPAFRL
ncbi:MAG: hypothetical protein FWB78_00585 [Treponema sp.]|nr:hypothetical protein [Treponema sp.]